MSAFRDTPLWLDQAADARRELAVETVAGSIRTDVCVIGGGFVGLWTALELKDRRPDLDVTVVEADRCGAGASGRNGGFAMSWWSKYTTLAAVVGAEEALRLARASAKIPSEIADFCERHGVDARIRLGGWLWVASNRAQVGAWRKVLEALEEQGERPFEPLSAEEARNATGSPNVYGGVREETCAVVQPALLAVGMAREAVRRGVRIFERSPVRRLKRGSRTTAVCPGGEIEADRVVLGLGSWTAELLPALRRSLLIVSSDMVATEPLGEESERLRMPSGVAISDSRLMVNYFHRTADDRVAFGTGGGALAYGGRVRNRFVSGAPRAALVEANMRRLYPSLEAPVSHGWTGAVDRSWDGIPYIFRQDRVFGAAGFSGNGVGPSKVAAKILASLVLQEDDEWAKSPLINRPQERFPVEPIRFIGGQLVRRAVAAKESAEDLGRSANVVTLKLASLAPAGLVPAKGQKAS